MDDLICLCCGWSGCAATCPRCGEASWSLCDGGPSPVHAPASKAPRADDDEPRRRAKKRGRR